MDKPAKNVFIYFDGVDPFWRLVQVNGSSSVDTYDVVQRFLEVMNTFRQVPVRLSEVTIYGTIKSVWKQEEVNLMRPFVSYGIYDILVHVNRDDEMYAKDPKYGMYRDIGAKFMQEKRYGVAFRLMHQKGSAALPLVLRTLGLAKSWEVLASNVERLRTDFGNDPEILEVFAKALMKTGPRQEAQSIYRDIWKMTKSADALANFVKLSGQYYELPLIESALSDGKAAPTAVALLARVHLTARNFADVLNLLLREPAQYKEIARLSVHDTGLGDRLIQMAGKRFVGCEARVAFAEKLYKYGSVYCALKILRGAAHDFSMDLSAVVPYFYYLLHQRLHIRLLDEVPRLVHIIAKDKVAGFRSEHFIQRLLRLAATGDSDEVFTPTGEAPDTSPFGGLTKQAPHIFVAMIMELMIVLALENNYKDFIYFDADFTAYYTKLHETRITSHVLSMYVAFRNAAFLCRQIRPCHVGVFIVGDYMAAVWNGATVLAGTEKIPATTHPIMELSIWDVTKDNDKNGGAMAFWDSVACAKHYERLVIMLGTYDCEAVIPKYVTRYKYATLVAAVAEAVRRFVDIVKMIKQMHPGLSIFVHPAIPRFRHTSPIVWEFNRCLRDKMRPIVPVMYIYDHFTPMDTITMTKAKVPDADAYRQFIRTWKP